MKQILVISDSHRHNEILNRIFAQHPDIDTCIFCGDIQDEIDHLNIAHFYPVAGNNDFKALPKELMINLAGYQFLIVHGHYQQIEFGTDVLEAYAQEKNVQIVCFGHTHDPRFFQSHDIYYINPGSVSFPRGGHVFVPCYAILSLDENVNVHFYHAKTHQCVDDLVMPPKVSEKPTTPKAPKKKKSFFSFFKK